MEPTTKPKSHIILRVVDYVQYCACLAQSSVSEMNLALKSASLSNILKHLRLYSLAAQQN